MEETTVSIIGIIVSAVIMFIVPLTLIADRSDDIAQLLVQTATAEFVDEIIKTGKITDDKYKDFISSITTSKNSYEIDMEIKILDENTARIGENNTYYSIFTSQIEERISTSDTNKEGELVLKQGDVISVTVKNSSKTLSQSLKSFYYNIKGADIQIIVATASGTVVVNGTR